MAIASRLKSLLDSGRFVLSAELTPPRGFDLARLLDNARLVAPYVDVVQLNDQLLSQARCSTLVAAGKVRELGLEPILQFSMRHRNRIAIQADLLGMAALDLQNLIVLGGYPIKIGSDPDARDATDIDASTLLSHVRRLASGGQLFNGDVIAPVPDFYPGTIEIPCMNEADIPASLAKLEARIAAGAAYVQVQAVFDLAPMRAWMQAVVDRGLHERAHFIAAVFPFSGPERLKFLQKVPGLCIPDHLLTRVQESTNDDASLDITLELIAGIRSMPGLCGLHLRSISAEDWVGRIFEKAGLAREPRIGAAPLAAAVQGRTAAL